MDTLRIQQEILDVFEKNSIYSFPIDCFSLLRKYGYECLKYSDQNTEKRATCLQVSDDAFRLKNKIYYNDTLQNCRIRFTLMHELGHHVLNHTGDSQQNEADANYFASNILAPRIAIHYSECKNANDVSHIFSMSFSAAEIAFNDYRRWRRYIAYHKMSVLDKDMYRHFLIAMRIGLSGTWNNVGIAAARFIISRVRKSAPYAAPGQDLLLIRILNIPTAFQWMPGCWVILQNFDI